MIPIATVSTGVMAVAGDFQRIAGVRSLLQTAVADFLTVGDQS
jgi:hypothetical protein